MIRSLVPIIHIEYDDYKVINGYYSLKDKERIIK